MKDHKELRDAIEASVGLMDTAVEAIEQADESADLESLERSFEDAKTTHSRAVKALERAEQVVEARKSLPVAPVEDDEPIVEDKDPKVRVTKEPLTYERSNGNSVFRDLAKRGEDPKAAERLERHMTEMRVKKRALSSTDAAGGYLVAPLYLQDEFVNFARAGRATADALGSRPLPPNTDSINIPTMDGGTTVAAQADNASVSNTDATFNTVAADVKTVAGYEDVSQQLVDRGVPGVDSVIFADLAKAYNVALDVAVLNSSTSNNKGLLQVSGINAVTYTDASPTVPEAYPKFADAIQQIATGIFFPADAIVMHPRRWAWVLASLDGNLRPLVTPYAPQNAAGTTDAPAAQGPVGDLQGLPVWTDSNIPTTLGSGTNEDRIIVLRRDECFLWEDQGGPYLDTFRDVGSGTMTVRFRLFNYYAQCHARRPKAISVISGTGVAAPTF